jgi:hypothetical protein
MGFAAAIAKMGMPDREVVQLLMVDSNDQELGTIFKQKFQLKLSS